LGPPAYARNTRSSGPGRSCAGATAVRAATVQECRTARVVVRGVVWPNRGAAPSVRMASSKSC